MFKVVKIFRNIHYHAQLYDNYVGHDNVCKQEVTSKQLGNKHIPAFTGWIMQFAMYKEARHALPHIQAFSPQCLSLAVLMQGKAW